MPEAKMKYWPKTCYKRLLKAILGTNRLQYLPSTDTNGIYWYIFFRKKSSETETFIDNKRLKLQKGSSNPVPLGLVIIFSGLITLGLYAIIKQTQSLPSRGIPFLVV